jgi:hypothetical protein
MMRVNKVYVCMYVCMHVFMYVFMSACMYVCMYACMHVYMYSPTKNDASKQTVRGSCFIYVPMYVHAQLQGGSQMMLLSKVCGYIYIYIYMCVCVCVCVSICVCAQKRG